MPAHTRIIATAFATAALFAAGAAAAEPQTRTRTFEGPRASGTQTGTIDRAARTQSRDTAITRNSDGATATRRMDRSGDGNGTVYTSRERTDYQGRTSSLDTVRSRTQTGSTLLGTGTTRNGETYHVEGERQRTDTGHTASREVTNAAGETVHSRNVEVTGNRPRT